MKRFLFPIIILLSLPLIFQSTPTEILKLRTFDALVKQYEPSGNFAILNITEEDVENEGGYPFPRRRLAEIQVELINAGAIGVGWVISFPQADRMGGDQVFATTLGYAPSVLAMFEDNSGNYPKPTGTVVKGNDVRAIVSMGVKENLNTLKDNTLQGLAIAPTEVDLLVRRIPLLVQTPDNNWIPSFGTQVYKSLFNVKTYIIKTNDNGIEEISIRGIPPVKTDSLGRKWISWVDTPQTDLKEMDVAGKFVFVGVTANGVMPQIGTPKGKLLEPHKIQAALAESILIQDSPYIPDWALALEILIFLISVSLIWLLLNALGITYGLITALFVMLLTAYTGYALIHRGILIDVTWTLISQFITGAIAFYLRFREQWKLREQIKGQFGTYISPDMVDMIVKDPSLMKLGGDRKEMTFMFADIVGFTPISEAYMKNDDPEGLVELINLFLDRMTKVVLKNGGTIDKYMGDCIMAFWNAPLPCDNHAEMGVKTAIEIELLTEQLNAQLKEDGYDLPPVVIGTGVNTGTCIVGNMGSELRFDYSVVGDAVNLGARLEVQTRTYDTPILISEYTYNEANTACQRIDEIKVKGKEEPVVIYAPFIKDTIRKLYKK
jgi:adenylate cyclase